MIRINEVALNLDYDETSLKKAAAKKLNIAVSEIKYISLYKRSVDVSEIKYISLYKRSVDARKKDNVHFTAAVDVKVDNENKVLKKCKNAVFVEEYHYDLPKCRKLSKRPVIIGSGPCGMFAALILAQCGQNPIIVERGRDVDSRTKDVNEFWSGGVLDEKSNVQFGEGGAGTFSDGKLNTGTKDKRIRKVLEEFAENGSPKEILYLAKPHIGTDMLKMTVKNIREKIISLGGEYLFETKLTDIKFADGK